MYTGQAIEQSISLDVYDSVRLTAWRDGSYKAGSINILNITLKHRLRKPHYPKSNKFLCIFDLG